MIRYICGIFLSPTWAKFRVLSLSAAFAMSRVRTWVHAESEQIRASGWREWGAGVKQPKVSPAFLKAARSRARSPCRTPQRAKAPFGVSFFIAFSLRQRFQRKSGCGFFAVSGGERQNPRWHRRAGACSRRENGVYFCVTKSTKSQQRRASRPPLQTSAHLRECAAGSMHAGKVRLLALKTIPQNEKASFF